MPSLARSARGMTGHTGHRRDEWQLLNPPQKVNGTVPPPIPSLVTGLAHCKPLPFEMIIRRGRARGGHDLRGWTDPEPDTLELYRPETPPALPSPRGYVPMVGKY